MRHTCDTPNCINPEHLVIGTDADNMQDKVDRDRQSKGTDFKHAKLTDDDVLFIKVYTNKGCSTTGYSAMAKQFGVSLPIIAGIMNGTLWKHVKSHATH